MRSPIILHLFCAPYNRQWVQTLLISIAAPPEKSTLKKQGEAGERCALNGKVSNLPSELHQKMVQCLINHFNSLNCPNIKAAYTGYDEPPVINGFIPDVYSISERGVYIGEAKTPEDLPNEHTEHQLRAFANVGTVILCVPDDCCY
jgi:hypothetical protein